MVLRLNRNVSKINTTLVKKLIPKVVTITTSIKVSISAQYEHLVISEHPNSQKSILYIQLPHPVIMFD